VYHLVILRPVPLDKILAGQKTIESRFGKHRPPAWKCEAGDFLFLKRTGGDIDAIATVERVDKFHVKAPFLLLDLEPQYRDGVHGPKRNLPYWLDAVNRECVYAVFAHLRDVLPVHIPASALPRNLPYQSAWMPLAEDLANGLPITERLI